MRRTTVNQANHDPDLTGVHDIVAVTDASPRIRWPRAMAALLVFCLACRAFASGMVQPDEYTLRTFNPQIQDGIDLVYDLRLDEAEEFFQEEIIAVHPDQPIGYFFLAMVSWWRILIDMDDTTHDAEFHRRIEACIRVCDRRLDADPDNFDAILFNGGAIGFRGRLRGGRGQYLRAAADGLRSLPLLEKSRALEPENSDILFGQGIYNYFAEVIPREIRVVRPIMMLLPAGNRELGLEQLREVARRGQYARAEADYFLAQIHTLYEEDLLAARTHLQRLHRRYAENSLFHLRLARTTAELGYWQHAVRLYREWVDRSLEQRTGYHVHGRLEALYYLGRYALYENRLEEAAASFAMVDSLGQATQRPRDLQYAALANLMLGMTRDLQGQREQALKHYDTVRRLPRLGNSHDLAREYSRQPYTRQR